MCYRTHHVFIFDHSTYFGNDCHPIIPVSLYCFFLQYQHGHGLEWPLSVGARYRGIRLNIHAANWQETRVVGLAAGRLDVKPISCSGRRSTISLRPIKEMTHMSDQKLQCRRAAPMKNPPPRRVFDAFSSYRSSESPHQRLIDPFRHFLYPVRFLDESPDAQFHYLLGLAVGREAR